MTNKQPEALRLAEHLENFRSFPDDLAAAAELRRQHARIVELESHLAAAQQGVPAQCQNINEPRRCWRVACQLGGKCREPERSATQPAAAIFGDEDHVLVPRGLIGAACYAIDKKRDGTKTLAELRRYTTGDFSAAAQPAAQGLDAIAALQKVRDIAVSALLTGSLDRQDWIDDMDRIAAQAKQGEQP